MQPKKPNLAKPRLLAVLAHAPQRGLFVRQIADQMNMPANAVSAILGQFLRDHWVERGYDQNDDRLRYYRLTELGRQQHVETQRPRRYRVVSGPVGIGAVVIAIQYLGDSDTFTAITRMLGLGALQVDDTLPPIVIHGEPVEVGSWVTMCAGHPDVVGAEWFAEHFRRTDVEAEQTLTAKTRQ